MSVSLTSILWQFPFLLGFLVSALVGIVAVGVVRLRADRRDRAVADDGNGLVIVLLLLATFTTGVFVTYVLLTMLPAR